jgi:hypothetical protein
VHEPGDTSRDSTSNWGNYAAAACNRAATLFSLP